MDSPSASLRYGAAQQAKLRRLAQPLTGHRNDYDGLMELVGDARFVLLGEATHGTRDFYAARAAITERLINEKGFTAVAVEADWPDAYRVNRYVRGEDADADADAALDDFGRFPLWMWRNTEVREFVETLRAVNRSRAARDRVGFYGLDMYSLYRSVEWVLAYLEKMDPEEAKAAKARYACLESATGEPQYYGHEVRRGRRPSCREEAVEQLERLRQKAHIYLRHDGMEAEDEQFQAERNAHLVRNAEAYYRAMFTGWDNTWNLRDQHMAETLEALAEHLSRHGQQARIVVWEHNSHVGDARATAMSRRGEHNLGQLMRQRRGGDTVLVGFTTYSGTVTAAHDWDGPAWRRRVRPGLEGSVERIFHELEPERFYLPLRGQSADGLLTEPLLERAIGVIYRPETERLSHYFESRLGEQFDAVFHFDHTRALEPLDRTSEWERGDMPETYPFGV
ncbi:erythromycin esterase [Alkalilimnicola ehrlichii]|uniref:Erythromycin esterase n=1 Tax=Alkalilimnicola ehrlichii TaxID=351052 RepID=A0A3E0X1V6_9GAMM|nr:erythromycin esterase family protein [Alkalilimnicola ehrlichii]RFA30587.1 erythromycin esterase [Alkalilimnicola ehrlichii]RFA38137.1 erythromycin esterase [Alkalilimnicola ehrlichii]